MNHFYQLLNEDKDDNRWMRWSCHRYEINKLINKTIIHSHVDNLIVLGAGNCDDLDLTFFGRLFHTITLVDIDGESTEKAVMNLDRNVSNKVEIIKNIDFTKLDQLDFYKNFQNLLENKVPVDQMVSFIKNISTEIRNYDVLVHLKQQYSMVVSSAVYTQLFYIHALTIFAEYVSNYIEQEVKQLIEELRRLRNDVVRNYNNLLSSLLKPGGSIILWTDLIKIDENNYAIEENMYTLDTEEERLKYVLEIVSEFGIEPAVVGVKDLYDKLQVENRMLTCWVWPFNNEKKYVTFGISGKCNA